MRHMVVVELLGVHGYLSRGVISRVTIVITHTRGPVTYNPKVDMHKGVEHADSATNQQSHNKTKAQGKLTLDFPLYGTLSMDPTRHFRDNWGNVEPRAFS